MIENSEMFGGISPEKIGLFCDGTIISDQQNECLIFVIGTIYGGEWRTNFWGYRI